MFTLHTAFALPRGFGKVWQEVDLSQKTLSQIRAEYEQVHLHVYHSVYQRIERMAFEQVMALSDNHTHTIAQFFALNGNKTIPTKRTLASLKKGTVIYRDAFQAGYTIEAINRLYGTRNVHYRENATDAWLSKPGVDYRKFAKNCLVAVNGYFHICDADDEGVYVKDAYVTCEYSGRNEVGIVNLEHVSSFECMPVTDAMIAAGDERTPMGDKMYLKIPDSKKDKLVALVAGGYLYFLDQECFYRVSDTVFCFEIRNTGFLDRFFLSEQVIDMSSLGLERAGRNNVQLSREQLLSEPVLRKFMKLSQTFLIFFDNPYIQKEKISVQTDTFPGMYLSVQEPNLPLFHRKGELGVYWRVQDTDLWEMRVKDNTYPNYLHHTTPDAMVPNPADNCIPHNTVRYSHAYFLKLSTSTLVFGQ